MSKPKFKFTFWRVVAALILIAGAVATYQRFVYGLGYATHLSDDFPWGIWIGFDVISGVGLAAGGFTITAIVYIFNLKKYHCIVKPTVLTAFMGYVLVGTALLWDLGKYYDIWHPLVFGNHHSAMFELAVCVMSYTGVLALEFSSIALGKFKWFRKPVNFLKSTYIVLVILGVLISTLHQSSLGTLYVIVPEKLHPLWYSRLLPIYFFFTAVGAGLSMTVVESYLSWRGMGHEAPLPVLANLVRGMVVIQLTYFVAMFEGLIVNHKLGYLVDGSFESGMWWLEITLWVFIPTIIAFRKKWLATRFGVFAAGFSGVLGFLMNRLNVSMTAFQWSAKVKYMPSWQEVAVSASFVVVSFIIFGFAVKYFDLFEEEDHEGHESIEESAVKAV
ncbi:MAG: Ni/Fe-hydrogenase cytochrome b subunit [Acidobacteria bacterium]|nr:Ni/Fe-hydrogenase cytochrome b subunit [Acidobacteriota bacterium]